ncbi:LPP20 family lipoprotein [Sulfurimonas sp.]|uniref:LPP20 family lipoprotein n=1 Tax=Sulfurimonas sp. TaxID=2022749 RepID=UPI0039E2A070
MKISSVLSVLLATTFIGCSILPEMGTVKKDECCPGYESVAQPAKCVKQQCMKETPPIQRATVPLTETVLVKEEAKVVDDQATTLEKKSTMLIAVIGQGVAPMNTSSPAQAYALAKRAAIADAYRLIAEKVKGVKVDGQDTIQNMMVKKSTIRTSVNAMIRNASVVETTFKEGLCEVEMEIKLAYSQFAQ